MAHKRPTRNLSGRAGRIGFLLFLLSISLIARPQPVQADEEYILILEADGAIVPAMENYISRGLERAREDDVALVIIRLDTPGGNLATTEDIVQLIRDSQTPVVVYVAPRGAMAASAGTLITLAGHAAAMAPETVIGAASPISGDGSDLSETADRKAKEIVSATARSLAERRGPAAVDLAERMITDAEAVSATEAIEVGLIDYIANNNQDLIEQMDGATLADVQGRSVRLELAGLETRTLEMSFIEQALLILTDPTLVFVLLSLGVILIILELRAPGGWVAGTLGVACFVLSLYGLGVLPINYLGLIFVGLAFVLLLIEIVTPHTFGSLSVAAAVSLAIGGLIMFNSQEIRQFGGISLPVLIGQSALIGAIGVGSIYFVMRGYRRAPVTGTGGMIGEVGEVRTSLDPQGMVFVHGEWWKAVSADGGPIPKGEPVRVTAMKDLLLTVEPCGERKSKE